MPCSQPHEKLGWAGVLTVLSAWQAEEGTVHRETSPMMMETYSVNWEIGFLCMLRLNENEKSRTSTFGDKIGLNLSDYNLLVLSF